jgi:hypothetical protein
MVEGRDRLIASIEKNAAGELVLQAFHFRGARVE